MWFLLGAAEGPVLFRGVVTQLQWDPLVPLDTGGRF